MTDMLLQDLRSRFRQTARIRLDEMLSLLAQLEEDATTPDAVERLGRHFHGLAGMGATYGFREISTLGDEAEDLIVPVVASGRPPDGATVARWREIVVAMEEALAAD